MGIAQAIVDFFYDVLFWFWELIRDVLLAFFQMLSDLLSWFFEQFLQLTSWLVGLLSFDCDGGGGGNSFRDLFLGLPGEILNVAFLISMPEALGMIITATAVRFFLQLVPFTRLGS